MTGARGLTRFPCELDGGAVYEAMVIILALESWCGYGFLDGLARLIGEREDNQSIDQAQYEPEKGRGG